jgi:hypothetical protein
VASEALVCARQDPSQFPLHPYKMLQFRINTTGVDRQLGARGRRVVISSRKA